MFEVGFSEIIMVALVALLVIGPEKLPKVARMAGFWLGKTRRVIATVKQEINEEFQAEELRQTLRNKTGVDDLQKLLDDTSGTLNQFRDSISSSVRKDASEPAVKANDESK
jgi:sec-independent protein translocase protein TatB